MSISEAARIAYHKTPTSQLAEVAEKPQWMMGPIRYYAKYMLTQDYPVYGISPPKMKWERISNEDRTQLSLLNDDNLEEPLAVGHPYRYQKVSILKSDLRARIKDIKRFTGSS